MEFLRLELWSSVSPFVQKIDSDLEQTSMAGSCGVCSQSCVWQSAPWPLLRDTNCCGGSLQGVVRCPLSSFRPCQQMLGISESLRLVCFFHNIVEICSLHFYDLDTENAFFNREFFLFDGL